jgi:hypothetical protein
MKIRFIKRQDNWLVQRKTWFRWKYVGYWQAGCGGDIFIEVNETSKEEALESALKALKLRRDTTTIIEYPTIKITFNTNER